MTMTATLATGRGRHRSDTTGRVRVREVRDRRRAATWDRIGRAADTITATAAALYVAVVLAGLIGALVTHWADLGPVTSSTSAVARRSAGRTQHTPTDEQRAVIDACHTGTNLVVEAAAGAGKTSTLRLAAENLRRRVLYVAYNKAAATEAKASFPAHVRCSTVHALAFGAVGRAYADRLRAPRQSARQTADKLGIRTSVQLSHHLTISPAHLVRHALATVDRFCQSADDHLDARHVPPLPGNPAPHEVRQLAETVRELHAAGDPLAGEVRALYEDALRVRSDLISAVVPIARRAWADLTDPRGTKVRFQHDHYLKLWALTNPQLPYDTVMLDEAQDSNPVTAHLVTSQQAQRIAIGDAAQQLYAWRGAVDALATWPADVRLQLTQSWRFGHQVAAEANKWLTVLGSPIRVRGNPHLPTTIGPIDRPDAVLCRSNAGAISRVLTALNAGLRPALVGGAAELIALAEAAQELKERGQTGHPELWPFTTWRQVQEYAEEPSGADLKVFVQLVDEHGADKLVTALQHTVHEDQADLVVSTAHKSKGREWDHVTIADDYHEPKSQPDGKLGRVEPAAAMLAYVAVTRGRLALDRGGLAWVDRYLPTAVAP